MRHVLILLAALLVSVPSMHSTAQTPPSEDSIILDRQTVAIEKLTQAVSEQHALRLIEQGKRIQSEQAAHRLQVLVTKQAREQGRVEQARNEERERERRRRILFIVISAVGGAAAGAGVCAVIC